MEVGGGAAPDPSPALTLLEEQFEDVLESVNNIFVAAGDGELGKVQAFVAGGVSVNSADEYGYTPLHAACSYGCVAVAQWLLAQGADANIRDADGDTPLFYCEDTRCADLLMSAGADVAAVNAAGHCAYFASAWESREPMLEWFRATYQARGLALPPVPPEPEEGEGEGMEYEDEEPRHGGEEGAPVPAAPQAAVGGNPSSSSSSSSSGAGAME